MLGCELNQTFSQQLRVPHTLAPGGGGHRDSQGRLVVASSTSTPEEPPRLMNEVIVLGEAEVDTSTSRQPAL
jgi:hypothetical protein